MTTNALVLFSGGQDSTTCLAWALKKYEHVETIGFDYRQRHSVELECRKTVLSALKARFPAWSSRLGTDRVLDLGVLGEISETALTSEQEIHLLGNGLPNTFVPGRNLLFFTLAAAVAYRRGIDTLVAGMCETDYSGYPDCRNKTIEAMQFALCLGMDRNIRVETPLMWLDKAATWELARQLGGRTLVDIVRAETHTCYLGDHVRSHEWGFGCGACPACELRERGYVEFAREASLA